MRILSFTTLFPNPLEPFHGNFVERRLEQIARACDVDVLAPVNVVTDPRAWWRVPREERRGRLTVYHPRFAALPGLLKHLDASFLAGQVRRQMRRLLARARYDLVEAHYAYPDGVAGCALAAELRRPFVVSLRGSDIHVLARFPRRRRLIEEMLRRASGVVAVSRALGSEAAALGADPGRIRVIPNGVDTARFFPRGREEARRALSLPRDAAIVLSVGRLAPVKGFDLVVDAARLVMRRMRRPVQCYIAGEGRLRGRLERKIGRLGLGGHVRLLGPVDPAELPLWYSSADTFCLLSRSEGCPNVVLEALACGTPVVAASVGGIPDLVEEGVTGLLVHRRHPADVADALEAALTRRWDRARIAASPSVQDWTRAADSQIELYRQLVRAA